MTVIYGALRTPKGPWVWQQVRAALSYRHQSVTSSLISAGVAETVRSLLGSRYSAVFVHRLPMMVATGGVVAHAAQVIFDLDDVEHLATWRAALHATSSRDRLFGILNVPAQVRAERRAMHTARVTLVCSESDRASVLRVAPKAEVAVVPNAVARVEAAPPTAAHVLLMVGVLSWGPNAGGAVWLVRHVLPSIRAVIRDVEVWLVGAGGDSLPTDVRTSTGVRVRGYVDDLSSVYNGARTVVCPLQHGSGTRIKLIEASMYGKPIVSSTVGAEGLGLKHEVSALLADSAADFAAACVRCLTDDSLCARLAAEARTHALAHFEKGKVIRQAAAMWRLYTGAYGSLLA